MSVLSCGSEWALKGVDPRQSAKAWRWIREGLIWTMEWVRVGWEGKGLEVAVWGIYWFGR
jgi:hypothetical protein